MKHQFVKKHLARILISGLILIAFNRVWGQSTNYAKSLVQTPEPGTYIDPVAKLILTQANKAMESNPDSIFLMYQNYLSFIEAPVYKTIDSLVGPNRVPIRIYYPELAKHDSLVPVIMLIHGGAFIWGSIETYDMLARKLTHDLDCIVVSVGYRLAPKNPFPVAVYDCYETLLWIAAHAGALGGNQKKIGLIGDSAGGNLATVMTLMSRDRNGPKISCQVLYYPSTDMTDSLYPSRRYFMGNYGQYYLLNEQIMRRVSNDYLNGNDPTQPYASPLFAHLTSDLPPALIITARCDPLRDEGNRYASELAQAGVKVVHTEYKGMIHGFVSFYPALVKGRKAINQTRKFVHSYLSNP